MQKILFATDLSSRADAAAQRAIALARAAGAELRVVHVVEADLEEETLRLLFRNHAGGVADATRELVNASEQRIAEQLSNGWAGEAPGYSVNCRFGRAHAEIAAEAREWDPDLVIIGDHTPQAVRDLLPGTTVEHLVHDLPQPVLVVKSAHEGPYRRVLVPMDFSERARYAAERASDVAPDAALELVTVFDSSPLERVYGYGGRAEQLNSAIEDGRQQAEQQLAQAIESLDAGRRVNHYEARAGQPVKSLLAAVEERGTDLVAMGTRGLSGWRGALVGSVARRLAQQLECDVLLYGDGLG